VRNLLVIRRVAESEGQTTDREPFPLESVDDRMIALMRLILALSALLIIYIDPSEPDRLVAVTYGALVAYSLYGAVLYFLSIRQAAVLPNRIVHWVDVGCFLILVALSSGTSSIFFFFFFFAILVASFRWGFRAGFSVTLCSALLFTAVGYATAPEGPDFELNRFLLRPVYMLVLGYMMAYWGGREIRLKRRLSLLKEITLLSNPRFGVGYTLGSVLKKLRAFYDAERGVLVWTDQQEAEYRLLTVEREAEGGPTRPKRVAEPLARLLLSLPDDLSVLYQRGGRSLTLQKLSYGVYDPAKKGHAAEGQKESEALAAWLDADAFVSVPLRFQQKVVGRLYLAARRGAFDGSDLEFLKQVIDQVTPTLDNIRLLERLASSAAEQERQRLARDIHDSVIQPYIGLQYRLAAIHNKIEAGRGDVAGDVERLLQSTVEEISGLRGFVRGLKGEGRVSDDVVSAVRRFAAQFGESYGIDVKVESGGQLHVNERLAAELIRFVHEGLSNVRKHTNATRSTVSLECGEAACTLRIENDGAVLDGETPETFTPGSITERAEALGGRARAERTAEGHTVVTVEIPL